MNNFYLAAIFSRQNQRRGGTCILCKRGYESIKLDIITDLAVEKHFEICGVEIKKLKLLIICIYRTPDSDIKIFFSHLNKTFLRFQHKKHKIIICGDFNIDLLSSDANTTNFKELMSNHGMQYLIHQPTRLNRCLDNIISNVTNATGETFDFYLSDHNTAQIVTIKDEKKNHLDYYFMVINDLKKDNISKFIECISSLSFSEVYDLENTNESFDKLHELLDLFFKLCFPCIKIKKKYINNKHKWITKGIKNSCSTKRSLRYNYCINRNNENKMKYKTYSNLLRKCMNNLQSLCNHKHITHSHNKIRATWDVVRRNMGNEPVKEYINKIVDKCITLTSGSDIANRFNNFFIDIAKNHSSTPVVSGRGNDMRNIDIHNNSIFLEPTNALEIYRVIMSLKNSKSAGYDNMTTELLKSISKYIASPLTHIINLSLQQGCFPETLKTSLIKPLHKKGSKLNIDNYNP